MSAESNATAARRGVEEGFNQGKVEVFDEICSPEIVTHDPAEPEDIRGIEPLKQRTLGYRTAMSDLVVTIEDLIASDDKVVTRWSARGTNDGEMAGMPATGKSIEITGMTIDRFDSDGKLVETWDQWDNAGFMAQLGVSQEAMAEAG
jgi:steroid delta-isomerase-like uncharacterized protein